MISFHHVGISTRFAGAALLLGTIFATGCLFEPREPLPPSGEEVPWISPARPENVIFNMKAALESKTSTNYENSLAEDFAFLPSPTVAQDYPGYFDDWGHDRELAAVTSLYQRVDSLRVEWNFDINSDLTENGNQATITLQDYEFFVSYSGGDQVVYEGFTEFTLRREGGTQWILVGWDESLGLSPQSWGLLRAELDVAP